jgi:hypothetical protein
MSVARGAFVCARLSAGLQEDVMDRTRTTAVVWALLTASGAGFSHAAFAQGSPSIVGMWTFVSSINEQNGRKTDTYGLGAQGVMVLDASGRYSITIIGADLPKFTSNNRAAGTAEETKAVSAKSNAHFGSYVVSTADQAIIFKIESGTFPNTNGTEQKRKLTVNGDELQYAVGASSVGGSSVVTWRRVK